MHDLDPTEIRRLAALVLVAIGVAVNWGTGWGLIVAGAGLGVTHVNTAAWGAAVARARVHVRGIMTGMDTDPVPRRTTAAVLVTVGMVALVVAGYMFAGGGGAAAGAAVGTIGSGTALGREG